MHDYEIEVKLFERVIGDISVTGKTRTPPIVWEGTKPYVMQTLSKSYKIN